MADASITLNIDAKELTETLSQLNELLRQANSLVDSLRKIEISVKSKA